MSVFARIFRERAKPGTDGEIIMIDTTHLKARRTAASLSKGGAPRYWPNQGRLEQQPAPYLRRAAPLILFLSAGQMSDAKGALALPDALPPAELQIAHKGHDADWFRGALAELGIVACIPTREAGASGRS
jgi:hypothetical protein